MHSTWIAQSNHAASRAFTGGDDRSNPTNAPWQLASKSPSSSCNKRQQSERRSSAPMWAILQTHFTGAHVFPHPAALNCRRVFVRVSRFHRRSEAPRRGGFGAIQTERPARLVHDAVLAPRRVERVEGPARQSAAALRRKDAARFDSLPYPLAGGGQGLRVDPRASVEP